jgi:isoleucyl-tRNA synthetase
MSKHLGNVLEPIPLMDEHGADAVRWFMLAGGSPWQARRVGHSTIAEVVRKTLLTYWNTVSFQALYARESGFEPTAATVVPVAQRPTLDRWAISEAHRLARDVDEALDQFDTQRAGRLIAEYVDDLSNWYVRRSRRRFWDGDPNALMTLHECLRIVTLVMAPFTPFITERVWGDLFHATSAELPDSVHLAVWPEHDVDLVDDALSSDVALVRRLVELGRGARAEAKVKTRQPLARALIGAKGWEALDDELKAQVAEELNVQSLQSLMESEGDRVDVAAKANFRTLGARFGKQTPLVANAIAAFEASALAEALRAEGSATVHVEGLGEVTVSADDVIVTETPREGWAVSSESGASVALDLTITDELRRLGLAREVVRLLQDGRKAAGYEVSDRIAVMWQATNETLQAAVAEHASAIAGEVLAIEFNNGRGDGHAVADDELGFSATIVRV